MTADKTPETPSTKRRVGRPRGSSDAYKNLAETRTRHEAAKAEARETANRLRANELLERADVERASIRLHATMANFLRGLPDDLERKCALPPAAVEALELVIDAATVELSERIADVLRS